MLYWGDDRIGSQHIAGGRYGEQRHLPLDYDELEHWTRVGYERGMASRRGER
jgi:hypothetical protein